jgi:uncharacterized membrane protein YqjE
MAVESRIPMGADKLPTHADQNEPLKDLLKQLAEDGSQLLRQEVDLAKMEMKETMSGYAQDGARIGTALMLALLGGLSLTAFLIIALGHLVLSDNYWLSSLIVAVLFLAIGGGMVKSAVGDMRKRSLAPGNTTATLKADSRWAKREVQELKRTIES